jgi:hypothetical protein
MDTLLSGSCPLGLDHWSNAGMADCFDIRGFVNTKGKLQYQTCGISTILFLDI